MSGQYNLVTPYVFEGPLDPNDVDDLLFDFTKPLNGATINSLLGVTVIPTGLQITNQTIVSGTGIAFTVASGTVNNYYTITAEITTSDGRTLNRSAILPCADR